MHVPTEQSRAVALQDRVGALVDAVRNLDVIAALRRSPRRVGDGQASQVEQMRALVLGIGLPGHRVGDLAERHADQLL